MANYNEIFVSNAFKTKDNKKVRDVLKDLFEDTYIDNQDRVIFGQLNEPRDIAGFTFVIDKNNCRSKGLEDCKQDLFKKLGINQ